LGFYLDPQEGFSRLRTLLAVSATLLFSLPLSAQSADPAGNPALASVAQQAGFVDALVTFCAANNRMASANYARSLQGWEERNDWQTRKPQIAGNAALQQSFARTRDQEKAELEAHRFKSAFSCAALDNTLRSAAHDPSITFKGHVASAAPDAMGMDSPTAGAPVTSPQTATPPATASTAPASAPVPAVQTPAPAGIAGAPITVGAMTVPLPPQWTVQKQTADSAILRTRTQHTTAVILLTSEPMTGDLLPSLEAAARRSFPGTGLTFKYPHKGVTGGGSPAAYVLDSGTLNRQYQSLSAVGYAIGGKLQMALLVSGQWGGDEVQFRTQFDAMMSAATLTGETGGKWDPLHPAHPASGRSGLFFGSALQNQLNPLGGMDLVARREYLLLLPTGQAYFGLPVGGHVFDLDFATACRQAPKRCGTYDIENGTITLTERDSYGLVTRASSAFTAGAPGHSFVASYHGTRASEVLPVHGRTLASKYTSTFAQTGNIGQSTSVVAQTFIAFSPNGNYQKSGFSAASFQGPSAGGTAMNHRGVVSGRYQLEGFTLTLTPADGQAPELYTAVFENQDPNPKAIFLNDKAFLRDGN
jgi:hypothetical protein